MCNTYVIQTYYIIQNRGNRDGTVMILHVEIITISDIILILGMVSYRYCQELQQCRAQAMGASKTLKDTIAIIVRHCHSLK